MKDQLLSIATYIESLEQRIAAQETAIAELTERLNNAQALLDSLQTKLDSVSVLPVQQPADEETEPEVEVELLVADEEDETATVESESDAPEESIPEPIEEPAEEPAKESAEVSLVIQPVEQKPVTQFTQTPDPTPSPASTSTPAPAQPQQTALFGSPVTDIRQAISIGDRFLFQRELFGGNGEAMQKLLDRLNSCANLNEAMDIVSAQSWDKDSSTYELFINVLRRRF
ncbi:MAG: hypothetical protein IJ621_07010 [Paludibacteraceae bacterium]|nr:hypothetical protein [Paludibacteraceae bacterium]